MSSPADRRNKFATADLVLGVRILFGLVAQKVHQSEAAGLKWLFKKIDAANGGHLNKSIVGGVAMGALVMAVRRLSGCRRVPAAIIVSAVLALWSSGAMAASNACRGAAGTSAVTGTAALLYLQCYYAIPISGNPLQTFGGSTFVRKNATTASYYLADRSNLGIDIVDGQALRFSRLLKPSAADPVGGFIGQLIWTNGPATTGTTRIGTPDESHSGPNGMAIYTDPSGAEWLFVADGGCNTAILHASTATPSSAGTEGACGTPADPSTLPNTNYGTANCINGTSTKGCYPTQHQPNVKLFNLTTNPNAEVVVAGKFPIPTGGGNAGPLHSGPMHPPAMVRSRVNSVHRGPMQFLSEQRPVARPTCLSALPGSRSSPPLPSRPRQSLAPVTQQRRQFLPKPLPLPLRRRRPQPQ